MPTQTCIATVARCAGTAAEFFARADFDCKPARACHSWLRRLPDGLDADTIAANLASAQARDELPETVQFWSEEVQTAADSPASEALRRRELARAVVRPGPLVRAVLLAYADGAADLVIVAHRSLLGRSGLDLIGAILVGADHSADHSVEVAASCRLPRHPAATSPLPDWGLGDPGRAGVCGMVPIEPVFVVSATVAVLLASTALVRSRYGDGTHPQVGLLVAGPDDHDDFSVVTVPVDDRATLADLVGAAELAPLDASVTCDDPVPAVGLLVHRRGAADEYRPFLEAPFPVTFSWELRDDGALVGTCWYDESALAPEIASQLARHVRRLVALLGREPDDLGGTAVGDVELVDAEETALLLAAGQPHPAPTVPPVAVHEAFRRIVTEQPDAPALSDTTTTLSYRELDERSDQFAAGLRQFGAGPRTLVGVCLERDVDLVVTILAVLKTGAAYVPMDPRYPAERLRYTAEDAGLRVLVSNVEDFPVPGDVTVVRPGMLPAAEPTQPPRPAPADPDAPAYVIYTSGSTGKPKGVVIPHRNVGLLVAATGPGMALRPGDVWTLFHSVAFDFSVWEIWGSLLTGGHLVVVPYWVSRSPEEFHALLVDRQVTVLNQTPSAFASLRDVDLRQQRALSLRLVVFGGEPLDVQTLELWLRRHPHDRCRLVNMFGITETTVHTTTQTITPAEVRACSRSVGTALPGWSVSVRDLRGRVQPIGVPGEVYVGGAALADCYLNQPQLSARRFVTDSVTGKRVYRSGDLGLLRPDGRLDHLGRIDDQVKVRGFRIEPGEIRAALLEDPAVSDVAVVLNHGSGDAADVRLDAYVVLRASGSLAQVRRRMRSVLPDHMVPGTITAVPRIPLTLNGKVDAAQFPKPGEPHAPDPAERAGQALAAADPQVPGAAEWQGTVGERQGTEAERQESIGDIVLRAWQATLGREAGPEDDFFDLGGNSLLAVRLSAALRRSGLPPVPLRELYLHPTANRLAGYLAAAQLPGQRAGGDP